MGQASAILLEKRSQLLPLSANDIDSGVDHVDDNHDVNRVGSRAA